MSGGTGAAGLCPPVAGRGPGEGPAGTLRGAGTAFGPWLAQDHLALGPLPGAVPCARLHARLILMEWGLHRLREPVSYIVSELVTNSVRACQPLPERPHVVVSLHANRRQLMIGVWDALTQPPTPKEHDIHAEGGRGLEIVSALATRWGCHHPTCGGKITWALLRTPTTASPTI
jgi:hypothetical protein